MGVTRGVTWMTPGLVTGMSLGADEGASDTDVPRGCAYLVIVRCRVLRDIKRFAFWRCQNKARVVLGLHPRMPEKPVVVRTMSALGIANVCYSDQPMRGKLLNKPRHVPPRAM